MDCFYAQIEMRDNPKLKNLPVAVGGPPNTRSVLCTSNYVARKFGVRAADPTDQAIKKCPNLIVIPPNFKKYEEASFLIHEVLEKYTDKIEPLSLDEAYLDLSVENNVSKLLPQIKNEIFKQTKLTSSIGLAPNKFLAKVASDWKKPDGQFIIRPSDVKSFVPKLDVHKIPGVGKVTREKLNSLGIFKCHDVLNFPPNLLKMHLKSFADDLILYANGVDHREVISAWERKSFSVESTFIEDISTIEELEAKFEEVYEELRGRLLDYLDNSETRVKKIKATCRFDNFARKSKEITINYQSPFSLDIYKAKLKELLILLYTSQSRPVRLIGLGVGLDKEATKHFYQPTLFTNFIL